MCLSFFFFYGWETENFPLNVKGSGLMMCRETLLTPETTNSLQSYPSPWIYDRTRCQLTNFFKKVLEFLKKKNVLLAGFWTDSRCEKNQRFSCGFVLITCFNAYNCKLTGATKTKKKPADLLWSTG